MRGRGRNVGRWPQWKNLGRFAGAILGEIAAAVFGTVSRAASGSADRFRLRMLWRADAQFFFVCPSRSAETSFPSLPAIVLPTLFSNRQMRPSPEALVDWLNACRLGRRPRAFRLKILVRAAVTTPRRDRAPSRSSICEEYSQNK